MRRVPRGSWLAAFLLAGCAARHGARTEDGAPPSERIVFFGDSLVHRSDGDHALLDLVRRGLERGGQGSVRLFEAGRNGDRIADLKRRLRQDVLELHPSVVVLYWDSDVSDVDEAVLSPAQVMAVRVSYASDVVDVLGAIERAGADVIMTGPTLIGEKRHGLNPKDAQLDAYASLNRSLAVRHGARYLDSRRVFLEHEHDAPGTDGPLTEDGEHLSASGVRLLARELVRALRHRLHWKGPARL